MIRFFRLHGHYVLGLSLAGLLAFALQEIPYMVMPLINPASNPIMNLPNELPWLERVQGVIGMLTMVLVMLVGRDDVPFFSVADKREKACFAATALMLLINFAGWTLYYLGVQHGAVMVITQFAAVPAYYLCFGLWKRHRPLTVAAAVFLVIHTVNGCLNFLVA